MDFEGRGKSPLTGQKRLGLYFVRPSQPSERGANEHANGIIRRRFPKGTGFAAIAEEQVQKVPVWIDNYPRALLKGNSVAREFSSFSRSGILLTG